MKVRFLKIIQWIKFKVCRIFSLAVHVFSKCTGSSEAARKQTSENSFRPPCLQNVGATCYLNAAFQGLSSCVRFIEDIKTMDMDERNLPKLSMFISLIDILNGGCSSKMDISKNSIFSDWNKPGQQDSFELLSYALNQVYNEIRKYLEETQRIPERNLDEWLKEKIPMRILIKYHVSCDCKTDIQIPLQSDLALHVSFPTGDCHGPHELQDLVDKYFCESLIEEYSCETCSGNAAKRITMLQTPLPNTLCIHLQRTYWNGRKMVKINDDVNFGMDLTIKAEFIQNAENEKCLYEKQSEDSACCHSDDQFQSMEENNDDKQIKDAPDGKEEIIEVDDENNEPQANRVDSQLEKNENDEYTDQQNYERSQKKVICHGTTFDVLNDDKFADEAVQQMYKSDGLTKTKCENHSSSEIFKNQSDCSLDKTYHLISVLVHKGSAYGGHYVCYKKVHNCWFLTNDSFVERVRPNEVFNKKAYILFYEKEG